MKTTQEQLAKLCKETPVEVLTTINDLSNEHSPKYLVYALLARAQETLDVSVEDDKHFGGYEEIDWKEFNETRDALDECLARILAIYKEE